MTDSSHSELIPEIVNLGELGDFASLGRTSSQQTSWKFVLIKKESRVHLVLGPVSFFRYHANLVDAFCHRFDIPASKARGTQRVEIYDRTASVMGGGQITVNPESRLVRFYGQSTAYGPCDSETISAILRRGSVFPGYSILVD